MTLRPITTTLDLPLPLDTGAADQPIGSAAKVLAPGAPAGPGTENSVSAWIAVLAARTGHHARAGATAYAVETQYAEGDEVYWSDAQSRLHFYWRLAAGADPAGSTPDQLPAVWRDEITLTTAEVLSLITTALTDYRTQTQIAQLITTALTDYRTQTQIATLIAAAGHARPVGRWSAATAYLQHDLAWTATATYLALRGVAANTAPASEPGVGTAWAQDWLRVGFRTQPPPPSPDPLIQEYFVTGDASPTAGSIAGDTYRYEIALGNVGAVGAARIVGLSGTAPHPDKADVTALVTIDSSDYADASGSVEIPTGVSLPAGQTYTLRLEVYKTGQAVATDQPYAYHDYRITATEIPTPAVIAFTVSGQQHPPAGDLQGQSYGCTVRYSHAGQVGAVRVLQFETASAIRGITTLTVDADGTSTATVTITRATPRSAGDTYTLRAEIYASGSPINGPPTSYQDWVITVVAPAADPRITTWDVAGDQAPLAGSIAGGSYDWAMATANTANIAAARVVGFKGAAPAAKAGYHVFVTLGQPDFAHSQATLTIPAAVSLAVGETYTLRLEVYKSGQAVATDTPVVHADWVITATADPAITGFTVSGNQHPPAGSIAGNREYTLAVSNPAHVGTARILEVAHDGHIGSVLPVTLDAGGAATGTIAIGGTTLGAGQTFTLRAQIYKTGAPTSGPATSQRDYVITAVVPDPSIRTWTVAGEQTPAPGDLSGDTYHWALATNNSSGVGALRIVGFKNSASAKSELHVFVNLTPAEDAAHSQATLTLGAQATLADGDTYTLRLEVYKIGQAVATDTPIVHADWVITATTPDVMTHFGWVLQSQDATDIDFDTTDHADPRDTVVGDWTVTGIPTSPADGQYRLYFAVPPDATQPTGYRVGALAQNTLFASVGTHTIDGEQYHIYLVPTFFAVDAGYNGTTIVVLGSS